jgi:hypothetical protein
VGNVGLNWILKEEIARRQAAGSMEMNFRATHNVPEAIYSLNKKKISSGSASKFLQASCNVRLT